MCIKAYSCFSSTVLENEKFSLTKKYFVKSTLFSNLFSKNHYFHEIFAKKCLRKNSRNFHTVSRHHSVEICKFFSPTIFLQKLRQINLFTKETYCKSIWRKKFFSRGKFPKLPHCGHMWKFKIFSATQILREINFGKIRASKSTILTLFICKL